MSLNRKHKRTYNAIFENPVRANIHWVDIESLFIALGAEVTGGRGSRIRVHLNSVRAIFHRPHPQSEANKPLVTSVRRFLIEANVEEMFNPTIDEEGDVPEEDI